MRRLSAALVVLAALAAVDPYGLVIELNEEGHLLRSLHDPGGQRVRFLTSVEEGRAHLYLGSAEARG